MVGNHRASAVPGKELPQGVTIPVLGLGTWELTGGECRKVVEAALEMGYRHIDTAQVYENEEEVGRALASAGVSRNQIFLTSKIFRDHLQGSDVRSACLRSLERLGTDFLDLCLVHWPNRSIPMAETLEALEALREAGQIRAWGVSNFTAGHLREALQVGRPATNQVELHPYFQQRELESACRELGVPLTAYSPLARGRAVREPALAELGRVHGKSPAQVALRWLVQRDCVVIPKASAPERLRENLELFAFQLSDTEMERIARLDTGKRLLHPSWAEFDREE